MHIGAIIKEEPDIAQKVLTLPGNPDGDFPILSAKIKLTWKCNLRCNMCNLWREPYRSRKDQLSAETVYRTIDQLKKFGTRKIHFSGGEILLYPSFQKTIAYAKKQGMQVNITTNGTLINKDTARFLINERVHTVTVSIDSPEKKEHDNIRGVNGAFSASWKGIDYLQKRREKKGRGPKIAVNTVITRNNIDKMDTMFDLLTSRRIDSWRLLPIDTEIKKLRPTREQWDIFSKKLPVWQTLLSRLPFYVSTERSSEKAAGGKFAGVFYGENICFAPWFNIFINPDGNVYPCCMGKQDMLPYGNINRSPVHELIKQNTRREICYSMISGHIYPACERCDDFLEENKALNALLSEQVIPTK